MNAFREDITVFHGDIMKLHQDMSRVNKKVGGIHNRVDTMYHWMQLDHLNWDLGGLNADNIDDIMDEGVECLNIFIALWRTLLMLRIYWVMHKVLYSGRDIFLNKNRENFYKKKKKKENFIIFLGFHIIGISFFSTFLINDKKGEKFWNAYIEIFYYMFITLYALMFCHHKKEGGC